MPDLEDHIKRINTKLQQLVKQLQLVQKENSQLHLELKTMKHREEENLLQISRLDQQVAILKAATGQMTEGDKKLFEKNINQYIREIDKCIGLLSE